MIQQLGKTVSIRTFDYGLIVRVAQNDKLVTKEIPIQKQRFYEYSSGD